MTTLRNSNNGLRIRTLIAVAVPIALASWIIPGAVCAPGSMQDPASGGRLVLRDGWQVQTSTGQADGAVNLEGGIRRDRVVPNRHSRDGLRRARVRRRILRPILRHEAPRLARDASGS